MNKVYDKLIRQGGIEEALCADLRKECLKSTPRDVFSRTTREKSTFEQAFIDIYTPTFPQPNRYTVAADTSETIFPLLSRRNFCPGARCHAEKNELYRQYESEKFEPLDNQTSMRLE